ncbi:MAG: hypothetical protein JW715_16380 [Sedimentisphaerales bacterium]|nr:hypothetical protein [Sedimentisphaerales bacterium]
MDTLRKTFVRFFISVIFGIAFGYIEAAVVVYLREIFYPNGFNFPLSISIIDSVSRRLLLTEVGREASTLVLIVTGAWLFGRNLRQRVAYALTIFAVWDIFYYVWLKVLLNWPASIMDWDILFLIPVVWAGPVLAPVLVSLVMLLFAAVILYRDSLDRPIKTRFYDWIAFFVASLIIVVSFCIPGPHTAEQNYSSYFYWTLFAAGLLFAVVAFAGCLLRS